MRLLGLSYQDRPWVAVESERGAALVAPLTDFYADVPAGLDRAREALAGETMVAPADVAPSVFVPPDAKILCVGLNYRAHVEEARFEPPKQPDIFGRWASTLTVSGAPVPVPGQEPGLDWEGELAAVVGAELRHATPEQVEQAILGYTCFNDLSARAHQRASRQWAVGKNADYSGPIGPHLVTRDELPSPYGLRLETRVDGVVMQDSDTAQMIFNIGEIGAFASEVMTLRPGDVIVTGTPQGIGSVRQPPVFLQPGQVVEVEIEKIGILSNQIVQAQEASAGNLDKQATTAS